MSKRSLKSVMMDALNKAGIIPEPPLAAAYRAATMSVCEVSYMRVKEWDYPRFQRRQKELDAAGIDYDDYSTSVVKTWWGWCKLKGMSIVSIPIFCGPKALGRYHRDKARHPHVEIDTLSEDIHQARIIEETVVVELYIGGYPFTTLTKVRDVMSNFQTHPPEPDIVAEVLDLMNRAYGFDATDYHQLARQHRKRYMTHDKHRSSSADPAIQVEDIGMSVETRLDSPVRTDH